MNSKQRDLACSLQLSCGFYLLSSLDIVSISTTISHSMAGMNGELSPNLCGLASRSQVSQACYTVRLHYYFTFISNSHIGQFLAVTSCYCLFPQKGPFYCATNGDDQSPLQSFGMLQCLDSCTCSAKWLLYNKQERYKLRADCLLSNEVGFTESVRNKHTVIPTVLSHYSTSLAHSYSGVQQHSQHTLAHALPQATLQACHLSWRVLEFPVGKGSLLELRDEALEVRPGWERVSERDRREKERESRANKKHQNVTIIVIQLLERV